MLPEFESDLCGVGLVAATDGAPSHRVVQLAIDALKAVAARSMQATAIVAFALAGFAQPVVAQAVPPVTDAGQPVSATATALVTVMADPDSLVMRTRRDVSASFRTNPELQALEADYPGITDAVIARVLPNTEQRVIERGARMRAKMAAYLSANMAEADLAAILRFFRSPTGTRMIDILRDISAVPMMKNVGPRAGRLSGTDITNGVAAATAANGGFAAKLNDAELAEVVRFSESDAGKKWLALQPGFNAATADMINQDAQASLPVIRAESAAAIADYKRDHPKKAPS